MNKRTPRILTASGELERPLNTRRLSSELDDYMSESSEIFATLLMRDETRTRHVANSAYTKPVNIVKRAVYGIGQHLITNKKHKILKQFLNKHSHPHEKFEKRLRSKMPSAEDNLFFRVYQLTFFDGADKERQDWMLSRDEISKHSRELYFAHMNKVPPEYLIGFIMQVGARNILKYYKDEDWFSWKDLSR